MQKQIAGCGDVISRFIPKIWQAQQRSMRRQQQKKQCSKNRRGGALAPLLDVSAHERQSNVPVPDSPFADPALSRQMCFHSRKCFAAELTSAPWLAVGSNRCLESFSLPPEFHFAAAMCRKSGKNPRHLHAPAHCWRNFRDSQEHSPVGRWVEMDYSYDFQFSGSGGKREFGWEFRSKFSVELS